MQWTAAPHERGSAVTIVVHGAEFVDVDMPTFFKVVW
jgi:hypothetical protein